MSALGLTLQQPSELYVSKIKHCGSSLLDIQQAYAMRCAAYLSAHQTYAVTTVHACRLTMGMQPGITTQYSPWRILQT